MTENQISSSFALWLKRHVKDGQEEGRIDWPVDNDMKNRMQPCKWFKIKKKKKKPKNSKTTNYTF